MPPSALVATQCGRSGYESRFQAAEQQDLPPKVLEFAGRSGQFLVSVIVPTLLLSPRDALLVIVKHLLFCPRLLALADHST